MALGALSALALPPFYLLPLLIPSFSGLYLLIRDSRGCQAFLDGWWWGFGFFTAGLYWICISLYVEPEKFAWLTPFALFGLPSVLAIYTGLVTAVFVASYKLHVASRFSYLQPATCNLQPFLFATLFVAAEYLRSYLFTGFPWNLMGYVWTVSAVAMQPASVIGIYGLSWITVFAATVPALFVLKEKPWAPNILALALIVTMIAFGGWRLEHNPTAYGPIKIRIVQANIPQNIKWNREAQFDILKKHVDLTRAPGLDTINLIIWPEAAIPYYVESDSAILQAIGNAIPERSLLVAGGLRGNGDRNSWQAWNSLFIINHKGHVMAQYDKHHLVPFGEFIPLRGILPVENISGGHGDFSRGKGPGNLEADDVPPFSPLICYEAIFPDEVTDNTHRAKWLLNITNDAWFGRSSGPYQHLQMARMRAVETGLPLVRVANTGISAVIDPMGRVLYSLGLDKSGIVDFYLPLPKL